MGRTPTALRVGIAAVAVALVCLGGCPGLPVPGDADDGDRTDAATTTDWHGAERVFLTDVENRSLVGKWPDAAGVRFRNLPERKRAVVREAIAEGGVRFGPDETEQNPFDWRATVVEFVRYRGDWYRLHVQKT